MNNNVSVLVQTSYTLFDDDGAPLAPGNGVFVVAQTDRIQEYIDLGQLIIVEDAPVETPVVDATTDTSEQDATSTKKPRSNATKQENLNG